ncbi:hypothetical protein [Streptomyces avermitilis]|uniref:hypothetical protein n=1 Tax=Streptomyces avermitilis TaxID=33903 RepID=UPI003808C0F4
MSGSTRSDSCPLSWGEDTDPLHGLGISPAEAEILTAGWSAVQAADLDVLRCYALRP